MKTNIKHIFMKNDITVVRRIIYNVVLNHKRHIKDKVKYVSEFIKLLKDVK